MGFVDPLGKERQHGGVKKSEKKVPMSSWDGHILQNLE